MFTKVFSSMFDGTLATVGPWEAIVAFQQILILSDSEGIVDMTTEAISRRTTIPLEILTKGIAALEMPDPHSRTPDEEGRRIIRLSEERPWGWRIVNYRHYREIRNAEDRRAYMKNYIREYRSKQRKPSVNNYKQSKPRHYASASVLNSSLKSKFEEFWQAYPDRNGKKLERAATCERFEELSEEEQGQVIQAARHYAASQNVRAGIGIRDPKRFLRDGKGSQPWKDWLEPEKPSSNGNGHHTAMTCSNRIQHEDGRIRDCGKSAAASIGSRPLCEECYRAIETEREVSLAG